jgi:hypothetical protein
MNRTTYFIVALISFSVLVTELFWTRIFSAEFFYTYAFLLLSLAILGLGLGALFYTLFIRKARMILLSIWLSMAGAMILIAVPVVISLHLDFSNLISEPWQIGKLLITVLLLGSTFFYAGIALAQMMKSNAGNISKLYMADLLGAGLGVIGFMSIMNLFGATVMLLCCTIPLFIASLIIAPRWMKVVPVVLCIVGIVYYALLDEFPEQKREEPAPIIYKHWDATAKIKVYAYDSTALGINIDNVANTPVYRFDGNWNIPDSQNVRFTVDVRNLIRKFSRCRFLSLGSGGGTDVLQALQYNASEIHALEVVPHINEMMKDGFLREFSGNIYNDPRVNVITEDARTYIRKYEKKFDIIYSLSSNSWAAFASGSFALAENYLFTTEAFKDYWHALSDSGFMSIEHQFYNPRFVAELMDALRELQVTDPKSHFAVFDLTSLRRKLLLVSKQPINEETIQTAYSNSDPQVLQGTIRLFPPTENNKNNLINTIVQSGWRAAADTVKIDISPCTDNRPFIAQLGLMRNADFSKLDKIPLYEFSGFPVSRIIMIVLLIVSLIVIVPLNLIPYIRTGEKLKMSWWSYFFTIGMAYMMIEVVVIQQYTLFIGSSVYSIALVLAVLLTAGGVGSSHASKYSVRTIFIAMAVWLIADIVVFKNLFYLFGGWSLIPRMVLSALLLLPAGYFMGIPFPKAASKIPLVVDWAFAVNGSASVIGSVVVMMIASSLGYSIALAIAAAVYGTAYIFYSMNVVKETSTH